jgi:hypothetical protein
MLRDDMVTEVRRRLGEDIADFWQPNDIINNLDMAVSQVAKEEEWPWLQTVGVDALGTADSTVVLPADVDFGRAFNIKLTAGTTNFMPQRVTPLEGFHLETRYTTNSEPRYFYIASSTATQVTLQFVPNPDKAYVVKYLYLRRPAPLTTNVEPDIPEDLHPAVVAWATAQLWLHELQGGDIKSSEQLALYQTTVEKARRELYKLQPDETLAWGMEADENVRAGYPFGFRLPDAYGHEVGWW